MNAPLIQPYLFFSGRCEEALEFYTHAIGAKIDMVMHFKDAPEPPPPDMLAPGFESKVMHASFQVGDSIIMASDGCGETENFSGFSLSLAVATEEEADAKFNALAEGGQVTMPLGKTFWSPRFGMLKDKFGIGWMVNVVQECGGAPTA
ncbi:PhnB protein [Prosthecobacter debontii]|uniref:PhnB protein n=1 Tax=Prosthecobacter debontii TaxID=48467 RepID=A0A1T4Z131_9BACT|nr:VOC family protein [Prosthecobacter debontii]SKB07744.1 PhnB protein [Prosthecobacter debontii]